ncbi:hypothetical protein GCM10023200_02080 [Actinomycetospora chlora]|uniref:Glycosyltransferase n=1 Tax=Actinomycetospora chlora TaxID=663608 RepID=A0ABP9A6J8_9PSEU
MTRPVVVLEAEAGGHRMLYLAAVASYLHARGTPVALASTAEALRSEDLRLRVPPGRVEAIDVGAVPSAAGMVDAVARVQADRPDAEVLVTEGDKFLPALVLRRAPVDPRRLRVLVMRAPGSGAGGVRARARDAVKVAAMRLAARRGAQVRVLEPATAPRADYRWGRWRSAPDPVDVAPGSAPPELAGADPGRHWLGVLGHVGPRKNLDLVLDAAAASGVAGRLGVLVAGRVEDGEWDRCAAARERFTAAGGTVLAADRLLDDDALDACLARVDTVVLAHSSEGPSGILGRAVALGTPVVAAGARSLRADVDRLAAGHWVPLEQASLATALAEASTTDAPRGPRTLAGPDEFARALLT